MSDFDTLLLLLAIALAIDAVLGEPEWLWSRVPHPVVLAGRLIGWLDWRLNKPGDTPNQQRAGGVAAVVLLAGGGVMLGEIIAWLPGGDVWTALSAAILLSHRSLVQHVEAVAAGLTEGLDEGRRAVSMIVGRAPESLDEHGVARAAVESAAENFADGVVAPAFWFLVGGLPGLIVYKLVNTADSMIGHRTEKHRHFGWAAARLDDLMNLAPARLTAVVFAVADLSVRGLRTAWRDAAGHRSPNAGWPEASAASILGLALAGPRRYGDETVDDPWMNPEGRREADADDVTGAVNLLWRGWGVMFGGTLLAALIV
jgi:adenosylcobinamide-phosphate synthase